MSTNISGETATIYQFPARGRFAANRVREDSKAAEVLPSLRVAKVVCGSSWYHEEAIQEAERPHNK